MPIGPTLREPGRRLRLLVVLLSKGCDARLKLPEFLHYTRERLVDFMYGLISGGRQKAIGGVRIVSLG